MALRLPIAQPTGQIIDYWRIDQILFDHNAAIPKIQVHLSCYISEELRRAGKSATEIGAIKEFPISDIDTEGTDSYVNLRQKIYERLKLFKEFEAATDC